MLPVIFQPRGRPLIRWSLYFIAVLGLVSVATAAPWGRTAEGMIVSTASGPALCLPRTASVAMSIGIAYVAEVETGRAVKWKISLLPGREPETFLPGQCIRYGDRSERYALETTGTELELNRKYIFTVDSARRARTRSEVFSYTGFFCPTLSSGGGIRYVAVGSGSSETCG